MKILIRGTNGFVIGNDNSRNARVEPHFSDSHLTLWTPWAEGIFRDADFVDEIIT